MRPSVKGMAYFLYQKTSIERKEYMPTARKLPSGSWRAQVYDYTDENGKRHYKSFTCDNPKSVGKKIAEKMAAEYALTKDTKSRSKKTFGQALEKYISMREPVVSPRTILNYKRLQDKDLKVLADIEINDFTQEIIQDFVNKDSEVHAPKTVRDNQGLIAAVIKQERPNFVLNTVLPKPVRPQLYIPSDDDVKKLIKLATDTNLEIPILLAAFGPMRRGEICALDTDNINGNVVHVCKNMVLGPDKKWVIKAPKSYAGDRFIDYPDFVAEKWNNKKGKITDLTPDNITTRFSRLLKNSGIPHFRFHDLRHYSASIQHALGIPDAYIMSRGGWGNDGVLKSVYRHAMMGKTQEMNHIANTYFSNMQHGNATQKNKPQ